MLEERVRGSYGTLECADIWKGPDGNVRLGVFKAISGATIIGVEVETGYALVPVAAGQYDYDGALMFAQTVAEEMQLSITNHTFVEYDK